MKLPSVIVDHPRDSEISTSQNNGKAIITLNLADGTKERWHKKAGKWTLAATPQERVLAGLREAASGATSDRTLLPKPSDFQVV